MYDEELRRRILGATTSTTPFTYMYFDEVETASTGSNDRIHADHEDALARGYDYWKKYTTLEDISESIFGLGNKPTIEEAGLIPEEYEASWEDLMGGQNGSKQRT